MSVEFTVLDGGLASDGDSVEEDPPSGPRSRPVVGTQVALRLVHSAFPAAVMPDLVGTVAQDVSQLFVADFVGATKSLFLQSMNTLLQRTCAFFVLMERYVHACAVLERELASCHTAILEQLAVLENARTRRIFGVVLPYKAPASSEDLEKRDQLIRILGVVIKFQQACGQPLKGHTSDHTLMDLAVLLKNVGSVSTATVLDGWIDCCQAFQTGYRLVDEALTVCKYQQENNLLAKRETESGDESLFVRSNTKKNSIKPLVERWEEGSAVLRDFTHFWHSAFFHSEVIAAVTFRTQILTVFENLSGGNMSNADLLKLWSFGSNGTELPDHL